MPLFKKGWVSKIYKWLQRLGSILPHCTTPALLPIVLCPDISHINEHSLTGVSGKAVVTFTETT